MKIQRYNRPKTPANVRVFKAGDKQNMNLLRSCMLNDTDAIQTALETGTDLSSPYNGAPLVISVVLFLLNDTDKKRFINNWELIRKYFTTSVPELPDIDIRLTNFTDIDINNRNTYYPILHLNRLHTQTVTVSYKNYCSISMGVLENCNLKTTLLLVVDNVVPKLELYTNKLTTVYSEFRFRGSSLEKMGNVIKDNAKYILDNMNFVERQWSVPYQTYYNMYNTVYTMLPPPVYAPHVVQPSASPPPYDKSVV